jgi:hypothetical protein
MGNELLTINDITMLLIGSVGYFVISAFMRRRAEQQAIKDMQLKMEIDMLKMQVHHMAGNDVLPDKRKNDDYYLEGDEE